MPLKDTDIMTFGAHKGKAMANVPNDYLVYIYDQGIAKGELRKYIEESVPLIQAQLRSVNKSIKKI